MATVEVTDSALQVTVADPGGTRLYNSGDTLFYGTAAVSTSSYDGILADNSELFVGQDTTLWFISAGVSELTSVEGEAGTPDPTIVTIAGADGAQGPQGEQGPPGADGGGATLPITEADVTNLVTDLAAKQPLDSDLTAIAALSTTAFGRSFLALANAAAGRTLLSLGTAATSATTDFDATGAAAAAQAASQPLDSDLTAIAALTTTAYGRSLLALADAAALRTSAGVVIGTDVQAHDAELDAIAGLTSAADKLPYFTGSGTAATTTLSSFIRTVLDDADAATARATLGAGTSSVTLPIAESDVTSLTADLGLKAPLASPTFTGHPVGVTETANNNSTRLASTAYVDTADALKANLASPTFTGTPAAPTPTASDNSTKLATTAYVDTADNLKANLASPTFTGTPAAPLPRRATTPRSSPPPPTRMPPPPSRPAPRRRCSTSEAASRAPSPSRPPRTSGFRKCSRSAPDRSRSPPPLL
jgi:hypothetical protein